MHLRRRLRLLLLAPIPLIAGGCGLVEVAEQLTPPTIAADAPPWGSAAPSKVLTARFDPGSGAYEILRAEARFARDATAATFVPASANMLTLPVIPAAAGAVTVTVPASFAFASAQLVTVEWYVDYRLPGGQDVVTAASGPVTVRLDCPGAATATFLGGLQTTVGSPPSIPGNPGGFLQTLTGPGDVALLAARGYVPSHGFRGFPGMGVAFAQTHANLVPVGALNPETPNLLMYAPNPAASSAAVAEANVADFPYTLIGFGYASLYDPGARPSMACMPHEAWFVHEAGWHLPDGTYSTDPPPGESVVGDAIALLPGSLPPLTPPGIGASPPWHPRLWDVHLWLRPGGAPLVAPCNVLGAAPGAPAFVDLSTCAPGRAGQSPSTGTAFPGAGFFTRPLPP